MLNYEIKINLEYNSTEILFAGKPSETVRETLKNNGFRWHKLKGVWYGRKTPDEVTAFLKGEITGEKTPLKTEKQKTKEQADKTEQKQLRAEFLAEIERIDGEKWVDYYDKETARVIKFENGTLCTIEKPRIKTDFCFGYGMYLQSTEEEESNASKMAQNARTNENYFISENLEHIDRILESLEKYSEYYYASRQRDKSEKWVYTRYYRNGWEVENESESIKEKRFKLTASDLAKLKAGYEIERANFEKRLRTYLKKYGTSKLNIWTYLVD